MSTHRTIEVSEDRPSRDVVVDVCEMEWGPRVVVLSIGADGGGRWAWAGHDRWTHLAPDEARQVANALLSAAFDAEEEVAHT